MIPAGGYPEYRAPRGNGEILCIPNHAELPRLVERNRHQAEWAKIDGFGRSLAEVALSARREMLSAAVAYTNQYTDPVESPDAHRPLIVTGHQPELFHPGVWLKNFEAARLAETCGGTAVNLIIDSDLCRWPATRVPTGTAQSLRTEMVPYDRASEELPFEERAIVDQAIWLSFGQRVLESIRPLVMEPLIESWWSDVIKAGERTANLGRAISQARHQLERRWGLRGLELPQSQVCQTQAFYSFAYQLISRASEFRAAYNKALGHYRAAHGIKNHAQPVPNLAESEGWTELPFWIWHTARPLRKGAFVRTSAGGLEISDRHGFAARLSTQPEVALEELAVLQTQGHKLRTRALTTTLFARLLLADLFVHGIGGAKYDQVTDEICGSFFGITLPAHATISGTLRLPISPPATSSRPIAELRRELREYEFHPEKHRDKMLFSQAQAHQVEPIIANKKKWIDTPLTPQNATMRHQAIVEANRKLQEFLNKRRRDVEHEIKVAREAGVQERLRTWREYACCLYPETLLRSFVGT